jgi:hypothetical protein
MFEYRITGSLHIASPGTPLDRRTETDERGDAWLVAVYDEGTELRMRMDRDGGTTVRCNRPMAKDPATSDWCVVRPGPRHLPPALDPGALATIEKIDPGFAVAATQIFAIADAVRSARAAAASAGDVEEQRRQTANARRELKVLELGVHEIQLRLIAIATEKLGEMGEHLRETFVPFIDKMKQMVADQERELRAVEEKSWGSTGQA